MGGKGPAGNPFMTRKIFSFLMALFLTGVFLTTSFGIGPMPSFASELTEKERWDLVNYIKSFARAK